MYASQAWQMLTRADEPMPVGIAMDWLREQMGIECLDTLRRALYAEAANYIQALYDEHDNKQNWNITVPGLVEHIRNFKTDETNWIKIEKMGSFNETMRHSHQSTWSDWSMFIETLKNVYSLCEEIEKYGTDLI
jgi:hypothetical protein